MARGFEPRRAGGGAMINGNGKANGKAKDYGLDLAVIGNGRTAALLEPGSTHRLVVLSALRQRSDLLAADDRRRGQGIFRRRARKPRRREIRICAQHRDRRDHPDRRERRRDPDHRFRAALPESRPHLSSAAAHPHDRADRGHCRASPSASARRTTTACRSPARRSAAITSAIGAAPRRSVSPPTRRSPISSARRRSC